MSHINLPQFLSKSLNLAHKIASTGKVKGIINCPIDKKKFKITNQGVTELLASKCKIKIILR